MLNRSSFLFFFILSLFIINTNSSPLMLATIKFPETINMLMPLPIFYDGRKIESEVNNVSHKIMFEIPWISQQEVIYILVTEKNPQKVYKPLLDQDSNYNTIDYLKLTDDQEYKLYKMTYLPPKNNGHSVQLIASNTGWHIQEIKLASSGQIPDHCIIISYFPLLINSVEGGTDISLPSLVMRNDMISLDYTEKNLYENTIRLHLSSLDNNAIHAPIKKSIQQNANKTVIIGCIA